MRRTILPTFSAALVLAAAATPASAAVLLEVDTPTGATASGTSIDYNFDSAGGSGTFDVVLDAFGTTDGAGNRLQDTFSILLNGAEIFSGAFRLGGRGSDVTFLAPIGAVVTPFNAGRGNGGTLTIASPFELLAGNNTLSFGFDATGRDELFGVSSLIVNGPASVPEPGTWAMMLLGFGAVGFALRGRKEKEVRVSYS